MGVGGQGHNPAALPPGKNGTHCIGGWVGLGPVWTGAEIFAPHRNSIPGPARLKLGTLVHLGECIIRQAGQRLTAGALHERKAPLSRA